MANDKEFELDDLESFSFDDLSLDDAPEAAGEQDPEGVWVKSAPEDISDAPQQDEVLADSAPETPVSDELPEEDFLSSEELANLDDSFDFVTVEEPQEGEAPMDDEVAFLNTPEAVAAEENAGSFDEVSLDDFVSFDDSDEPKSETILSPIMDTPAEEDDFPEEFLDIDIDIDDEIGDEVLEVSTPKAKAKPETPPAADNVDAESIDLAEFGDFEEVSPVAEPLGLDELDLPPLDTPPEMPGDADDGFFEEEVFEEAPPAALEPDDSTDMDHILALEEDLTSGIRESDAPLAPAAAPAGAGNDLAAAILGKIEQELSSIKQEISALKEEVTNMRAVPGTSESPREPVLADADADSKPSHGGFFDDDEDEAIALTGDELDNLLSTAEVSEGEEAGVSLEDDLLEMDPEGNLIEPETHAEPEDSHVTDEEFLAGTALDLNEPDAYDVHASDLGEAPGGVPESIELEEDLPQGLEDETDDLLASEPQLDIDDAGLLSDEPEVLPPFEPEAVSLEPDLPSDTLTEDIGEEVTADFVAEDIAEEPAAAAVESPMPPAPPAPAVPPAASAAPLATGLKDELRAVLSYMDKLLASLPDDKIQEFAESEHFEVYKRLFEELGLIE